MGRTLKLRVHTWPFLPGTQVVTISWARRRTWGGPRDYSRNRCQASPGQEALREGLAPAAV